MTIYAILFALLAFLYYHYDIRKELNYKDISYFITCVVLICVAGLRYRIGYDTTNYMSDFSSPYIPALSDFSFTADYGGDVLWILINSFAKSVGGGFCTVQFVQAIIVNAIVFWFIKRHSPQPFLAVLLYFMFQWWNYCFEAMRESIAIAFYLFALDALITKKSIVKYYLRAWPAIFAHTFGFVVLIFPLLRYIRINKYLPVILVVFGLVCISLSDILTGMVENILTMGIDSSATSKMVKYIDSDVYGEANLSLAGIISLVISRIMPISAFIYMLHKTQKPEAEIFIPYLIAYIFVVCLRMAVPIFFRFFNYFEIMLIIAITQTMQYTRPKTLLRYLAVFMLSSMVLIRTYELTKPEGGAKVYNRYVPYNSVFSQDYNERSESIFRYY